MKGFLSRLIESQENSQKNIIEKTEKNKPPSRPPTPTTKPLGRNAPPASTRSSFQKELEELQSTIKLFERQNRESSPEMVGIEPVVLDAALTKSRILNQSKNNKLSSSLILKKGVDSPKTVQTKRLSSPARNFPKDHKLAYNITDVVDPEGMVREKPGYRKFAVIDSPIKTFKQSTTTAFQTRSREFNLVNDVRIVQPKVQAKKLNSSRVISERSTEKIVKPKPTFFGQPAEDQREEPGSGTLQGSLLRKEISKSDKAQQENLKLGIPNIGNTCYLNAPIQCLFHLPNFNHIFEAEDFQDQQYLNPKHRGVALRYCELYRKVSRIDKNPDLSTFHLKRAVAKKSVIFVQWDQQDAYEFFQELLDSLSQDLNRVTQKQAYRSLQADRKIRNLSSLSLEYWNYYRKHQNSHVIDYFCGQILSSVVCNTCKYQSLSFDNFLDLSLPIPKGKRHLQDLIDSFLKVEELDDLYFCSKCQRHNKSTRKLDLWKVPKVLTIHLKRTKFGKVNNQKIKEKVTFPFEMLNIRRFMPLSNDDSVNLAQYDLTGVVSHVGSSDGGHYFAHCKDIVTKKWYLLNDQQVQLTDRSKLQFDTSGSQHAYMLYYTRKDNR